MAFKNLKYGKEKAIVQRNETFSSDINAKYVNLNQRDMDEKEEKEKEKKEQGVVNKLGNEEEFNSKMQEIANNENYDWNVGVMEIDDFDSFVFSNNNNKEIILKEIVINYKCL